MLRGVIYFLYTCMCMYIYIYIYINTEILVLKERETHVGAAAREPDTVLLRREREARPLDGHRLPGGSYVRLIA